MDSHHPVFFPIRSPKRKAKPPPSVNLLFHHRLERLQVDQADSPGNHSLPQPEWWVENLSFTSKKRIHVRLISLLLSPFPYLPIPPSFSWYGVSCFYLTSTSWPLLEFLLFLLGWQTPEGNIISPTSQFFHFTSRGKSLRESTRTRRCVEMILKYGIS